MTRTDEQNITLAKVRVLHNLIEQHPYLSGFMGREFHAHLDDVIRSARQLDDIDRSEWRKEPTEDDLEKWLEM